MASHSDILRVEDIRVKEIKLSYGTSTENPVQNVTFYDKLTNQIEKIDQEKVSLIIPSRFSETLVRVYVVKVDLLEEAKRALTKMLGKKNGMSASSYDKIDKSPIKSRVRQFGDSTKK